MTLMGWVFLVVSWSVLSYFTVWCMVKILKKPFEEEAKPPADSR
jgi:hypothetical protein